VVTCTTAELADELVALVEQVVGRLTEPCTRGDLLVQLGDAARPAR
jgi:hypothetical protein